LVLLKIIGRETERMEHGARGGAITPSMTILEYLRWAGEWKSVS
jgi:hypothetical protein